MPNILKFTTTVELETKECSCGGIFAITSEHVKRCRTSGGGWHCPYCRGRWGFNVTELDRQKQLAADAIKARDAALSRANEARAEADRLKAEAKRTARRSAAGVCPCCHRTFKQMARHMKTKHPDYS